MLSNLPRGSSQVTVCFSQGASLMPTCFTSYSSHCMFWCAVALFYTTASLLFALCFHYVISCSSLHWVPVLQPLFALCSFIISGLRTLSQSDTYQTLAHWHVFVNNDTSACQVTGPLLQWGSVEVIIAELLHQIGWVSPFWTILQWTGFFCFSHSSSKQHITQLPRKRCTPCIF